MNRDRWWTAALITVLALTGGYVIWRDLTDRREIAAGEAREHEAALFDQWEAENWGV